MVHFGWAQYKRQAHHDGRPKGQLSQSPANPSSATPGPGNPPPPGLTAPRHWWPRPSPSTLVVVPATRTNQIALWADYQLTESASTLTPFPSLSSPIITEKSPRRIGHLGDFHIGQVSNFSLGQVSKLSRRGEKLISRWRSTNGNDAPHTALDIIITVFVGEHGDGFFARAVGR
jgi:hypothetical protein